MSTRIGSGTSTMDTPKLSIMGSSGFAFSDTCIGDSFVLFCSHYQALPRVIRNFVSDS